jgi:hypothetical protein
MYSLRSILSFANMNVSTTKMYIDIFILAISNMGQRDYIFLNLFVVPSCTTMIITSDYIHIKYTTYTCGQLIAKLNSKTHLLRI